MEGKWTALVPWSELRMIDEGLSTSNIASRFKEISEKLDNAPTTREKSNSLVRVLKGVGNILGRTSTASLTNRIKSLNL